MKQNFLKYCWIYVAINPFLFGLCAFFVFSNVGSVRLEYMALAVVLAILNSAVLFLLRKDPSRTGLKKLIRWFSLLFATPITIVLLIFYSVIFEMTPYSFSAAYGANPYSRLQCGNYFKVKNLIIIHEENDSIEATISKSERTLEKLVRIRNGQETAIDTADLH